MHTKIIFKKYLKTQIVGCGHFRFLNWFYSRKHHITMYVGPNHKIHSNDKFKLITTRLRNH